ncbi:peptidoglycan-N-acetylglucosamine deacetylase [Abditibacteriota bacterium]|nr:peptidoglycan-N-acetylglucosamine deacetylase [Abditibacteriota bacterium]
MFPSLSQIKRSLVVVGALALVAAPIVHAQTITTTYDVPIESQGYVFNSVPVAPTNKVIALTFDDGPQPGNTEAVLQVLADNNAKATFFEMGSHIDEFPELTKMVKNAGHALGNHTYNHLEAPEDPAGEVTSTDAAFARVGISTQLFRPPFGNFDNGVIDAALNQGDAGIIWSVDPQDWSMPGTQSIIDTVVSGATPGGIVLMHDGGGDRSQTIAALPVIIQTLRAQGYSFLTVPELLRQRNDLSPTPTPVPTATTKPTSTPTPKPTTKPTATPTPKPTAKPTATPTPKPTAAPTPTPVPATGDGLSGSYYNRYNLFSPTATRVDKTIDFKWGSKSPISGVKTNQYAVSWSGDLLAPKTGSYNLSLVANGWTRVWLNNNVVMDHNRFGSGTANATLSLTGGTRYPIRIDYISDSNSGQINFWWKYPSKDWQIVPQGFLFSKSKSTSSVKRSIASAGAS